MEESVTDQRASERVDRRWIEIGEEVKRAPGYTEEMEDLQDFFNLTAELWDEKFGPSTAAGYVALARQIEVTDRPVQFLDLGCGTGPELDQILYDQQNSRAGEQDTLERFEREVSRLPGADRAGWNYDITLTAQANAKLMKDAGFAEVDIIQTDGDTLGMCLIRARARQ